MHRVALKGIYFELAKMPQLNYCSYSNAGSYIKLQCESVYRFNFWKRFPTKTPLLFVVLFQAVVR